MAKKPKSFEIKKSQANSKSEFLGKVRQFVSDRKYPAFFSLATAAVFSANFWIIKSPAVYTATAALAAFFSPGYALLDIFFPKGNSALENSVERVFMSIALSLCFTVLFVSIVNLWLAMPLSKEILAILLVSFNVLVGAGRLVSIKVWNA